MYRFVNFKGFADASIDVPRGRLTTLIGRNGSGKSNAIEAMAITGAIVGGAALDNLGGPYGSDQVRARGGLAACLQQGKDVMALAISEPAGQLGSVAYKVDLKIPRERSAPQVVGEQLWIQQDIVVESRRRGPDLLRVKFLNTAAKMSQVNRPADKATVAYLVSGQAPNTADSVLHALFSVVSAAPAVQVLAPVPDRIREYIPAGRRYIDSSGASTPAILFGLARGSNDEKATLERIVDVIRQLPEEPVEAIEMVRTALGDVSFALRMHGVKYAARLVSDGTLRVLAIATALETVASGPLIAIEDVDDGVHPARLRAFVQYLSDVAARRKLRILITTHNPATLDALTQEQRQGVVVCHWDAATKASLLTPLPELHDYLAVLTASSLGAAARDGVIDEAARVPTAEEDAAKMAQALHWIDNLRSQGEP